MNMLERVYDYLVSGGIIETTPPNGWNYQQYIWNDNGVGSDKFIVLQPNGGTQIRDDLGSDYYFSLYVIGNQGNGDIQDVAEKVDEIIDYIKNHPLDSCLGYIQMQGPTPRPMLTEEKRVVFELMLRVVWGD